MEDDGKRKFLLIFTVLGTLILSSCCFITTPYNAAKGTVKATYKVTKGVAKTTIGAGKLVY